MNTRAPDPLCPDCGGSGIQPGWKVDDDPPMCLCRIDPPTPQQGRCFESDRRCRCDPFTNIKPAPVAEWLAYWRREVDDKPVPVAEWLAYWRREVDEELRRAQEAGECAPNIGEDFVDLLGIAEDARALAAQLAKATETLRSEIEAEHLEPDGYWNPSIHERDMVPVRIALAAARAAGVLK